jgi:hypothetical protein
LYVLPYEHRPLKTRREGERERDGERERGRGRERDKEIWKGRRAKERPKTVVAL